MLALVSGVAHGVTFPSVGAWPLAFAALAPLLVAVRGRSGGTGTALGWLAGSMAAGIAVVPWLAASARDFFGVGPIAAAAVGLAAGQVFGAAPIALFGGLAAVLSRLPSMPARLVTIAAAWSATELLRTKILTGLPWDLLGHALYRVPSLVQIAELGGVPLVSYVLVVANAAIAECATAPRGQAARALALATAVLALDVGYGAVRLGTLAHRPERLRIALVQGDVPNAWRNDPTRVDEALRAYADLTRTVLPTRPDLVVWPENAVSVLLDPNPRVRAALGGALAATGVPLVLGAPRAAPRGSGRVELFNSAHLLAADGTPLAVYDKRHLVPFAEYRPVQRLAGLEVARARPGDYTAGTTLGIFPTPTPFGVLICFEVIYPDLARELVAAGARLLVNVSNDAWFPGLAAREQHFATVVFRAIELRRPVVRVANAGITAAVDASGRIVARFPTDVPGAWTVTVEPGDSVTLFARTGDLFAWLAAAVAIAAFARARRVPSG